MLIHVLNALSWKLWLHWDLFLTYWMPPQQRPWQIFSLCPGLRSTDCSFQTHSQSITRLPTYTQLLWPPLSAAPCITYSLILSCLKSMKYKVCIFNIQHFWTLNHWLKERRNQTASKGWIIKPNFLLPQRKTLARSQKLKRLISLIVNVHASRVSGTFQRSIHTLNVSLSNPTLILFKYISLRP